MDIKAKRPEGTGRGNGSLSVGAAVPANKTPTDSDYTPKPAEPAIRRIEANPVRTWRAVARHMQDHDLRVWRARVDAVLTFAAFESPYPEHDEQIIGWQIEAIEAELTARERRQSLPVGTTEGFSDTFIADLKQRLPLDELIENGGDALRKAGKEYRGDCPFHESKSRTSLTVSPDKGLWRCHGCGRGGDHYTWLAERWNVEFPDAVRILATLARVEIPKQPTSKRQPKRRAVSHA